MTLWLGCLRTFQLGVCGVHPRRDEMYWRRACSRLFFHTDLRGHALGYRQDCVELFHQLKDELHELREQEEGREQMVLHTVKGHEEWEEEDLEAEEVCEPGAPVLFWTLFLGQPGTGKTVINLQLLFTFMKKGYIVVYHERKMGTGYAVFKKKKFDSMGDRAEVEGYLRDQWMIFINDSEPIRMLGLMDVNMLIEPGYDCF
ncbi:hypothetical protein SELMODRAFT_405427 [Selaginella moellendorffii]|uniref:Uncharacterized protein n=1 Tax=Selaginella moellendorffii TaxID=88036 RepID=D8QYJ5_SELML|nr:hypothetical protein SELMODRAFT_405427 [Selaginella moellendorffii]